MNGVTMQTAIAIFTNPYGLEFVVSQDANNHKFGFGIFFGEERRFRPLLTTKGFVDSLEEVLAKLKEILDAICEAASKELEDPKSTICQIINPELRPVDQLVVVKPELVSRILEQLREKRSASTCGMIPVGK